MTRTNLMLAFFVAAFMICCIAVAGTANNYLENNNSERSAGQLYAKYCSSCHGKDGRGKTMKGKFRHARDLTDSKWQDDVSDERIFNSIMNGRKIGGDMPAFGKKLTEQEGESLATYVRGLKK